MQPEGVFEKEKTALPTMAAQRAHAISPAVVNRVIIGIILLIVLVQVGFFKTYIQHFPNFEDRGSRPFTWMMHFHGMLMMGWILMLLVQAILILKGKITLHRRLGRLSYVLAPLIVLSLYLVNRDQYIYLSAHAGTTAAVTKLATALPEGVFFIILYSLAMFYKHRPALHMRYMCSTPFLFINPAMGRMFRTQFGFEQGFPISSTIVLLLAGIIALVDSVRTKRISVFFLVFAFLLLHRIIWELRETPFWQAVGSAIAKIF